MANTLTKLIAPSSTRKAKQEELRASQLQKQQETDIRLKAEKEEKKRKSRAKALEARSGGGLGVTLFMSELGVQPGRATTLGGT